MDPMHNYRKYSNKVALALVVGLGLLSGLACSPIHIF
jgi:hypothetical protein